MLMFLFLFEHNSLFPFWMLKMIRVRLNLCRQPTKIEKEFDNFIMNFLKMGLTTLKASQPL